MVIGFSVLGVICSIGLLVVAICSLHRKQPGEPICAEILTLVFACAAGIISATALISEITKLF